MMQALQLGLLSATNIGLAFLFQWYLLVQLGPGLETDALFAGMTVPQLVLAVISGSLMHVLVPLLAGESEEQLRHDAWGFLVLVGGSISCLAVVLFLTASWWIPLALPGFSPAGQELTVALTRIQLVGMVLSGINGVQWAAYHARQQFIWAEFTPIVSSLIGLTLLIWLLPLYGVVAAAWISTLRMALQTVLLIPAMGKPVWPDLKSPTINSAWQRIKPLLLGTAYYKTDPLVDRFLLSNATSGSLSLYYLAQQIYGAVIQVVNKAITAPLVPLLSRLYKVGNIAEFRRVYRQKLLHLGIIGFAGFLVLGFFGQNLLGLLIGHGNITAANVNELWWMMIWLGGMFIGSVLGQISSSSFYAIGDTATPTRLGIYTYSFYVPAKIVLFYSFGVMGLALATSAFLVLNFSIQHLILKSR